MSKQITVRLPDDAVDFIDQMVGQGRATSRAGLVARALEHERRRELALRDVSILSRADVDGDDLDELARYTARTPLDLD